MFFFAIIAPAIIIVGANFLRSDTETLTPFAVGDSDVAL